MVVEQDFDIIGVMRRIANSWRYWSIGAILGGLLAYAFVAVSVPRYEARMMVGPAAQMMQVSVESRVQAGDNSYRYAADQPQGQGRDGVSSFTQFSAKMRGVGVAKILVRDPRIIAGLRADRHFIFQGDDAAHIDITGDITSDISADSAGDIAGYIRKNIAFDPFGETAMREIVYAHPNPDFAQYFVQRVHRVADQLIRGEMRDSVNERILYLERSLATTLNPDQRRVITNLLMEEERQRMVVSMDAPVAAQVFDAVWIMPHRVWPKSGLVYVAFISLGVMIGYLVFALRYDFAARGKQVHEEDILARELEDLRHQLDDSYDSDAVDINVYR